MIDDFGYADHDLDEDDGGDDERQYPTFGCACENALCVDTVCASCIERLRERGEEASKIQPHESGNAHNASGLTDAREGGRSATSATPAPWRSERETPG